MTSPTPTEPAEDLRGLVENLRALVEELRAPAKHVHRMVSDADLLRQSADTIERLSSRLEAVEGERDAYRSDAEAENRRAQALQGQLDRAVEVMKPFAIVAEHDIGESEDDADSFRNSDRSYARAPAILVGDLRRVRAFLASIPQEEEKT